LVAWLARIGLVTAGVAAAIAAVVALLAVIVLVAVVFVDGPEPPDPAELLERRHDGTSVEQCLPVVETGHGRVWICSFFRISSSLAERLREVEPTTGSVRLRIACFLGPQPGHESDGSVALGYAAPDRLTSEQRCREEIDWVRALPEIDVPD
jgi:hypothetical protein